MEFQRTVEIVLDVDTGEQIYADHFFGGKVSEDHIFQLRADIEKRIQTHTIRHVCACCKQPVAIKGRSNQYTRHKTIFFTHLHNSVGDCIYKTEHRYTEEQVRRIKYNGEKESVFHDTLKNLIAQYLRNDPSVSDVHVERVYKDKAVSAEWRKPDVLATWNDTQIAFELQLSTTFLSVIVGRTLFYQQRNVFLLWVFPNFSVDNDIQRFTQKDVYYNNSFNVYVFDNDAQSQSTKEGKLMLKCFYMDFSITNDQIVGRWNKALISLDQLSFNKEDGSFYYRNSSAEKKALEMELNRQKQQRLKELEKRIGITGWLRR